MAALQRFPLTAIMGASIRPRSSSGCSVTTSRSPAIWSLAAQLWRRSTGARMDRKIRRSDSEVRRVHPRNAAGLANQGWKDSFDSISHADGTLACAPIALCEVQGYVYAAYTSIRRWRANERNAGSRLSNGRKTLKSAFSRDFWLQDRRARRPCPGRRQKTLSGDGLQCGPLSRDRPA